MDFSLKKSISRKFITAFVILIVIPVIAIGVIFANLYLDVLIKNLLDKNLSTVKQTAAAINSSLTDISIIASKTAHNEELLELLADYWKITDNTEKFRIAVQLQSLLNLLFNLNNLLEIGIFFYSDSGNFSYLDYPLYAEEEIRAQPWYTGALDNKGYTYIISDLHGITQTSKNEYLLSVCISPRQTLYINNIELIYLSFRNNYFQNLSARTGTEDSEIFILDSNNNILLSKDKDDEGLNISDKGFHDIDFSMLHESSVSEINGRKMFLSFSLIPKTGWKIVRITDYSSITKEISVYNILAIIIFIIVITVFTIYSLILFFNIIIPIRKLIGEIKLVEKGHFNLKGKPHGSDEIYQLNKAFYEMVRKLDQLTLEKEQKEKQRLKAELEALRFQINPHFISNTLNSIRLMAMIAKNDNIKRMIDGLIKFFSFVYKWEPNMVSLEEIISNIKTYIFIMKIRFGEKFDVEYDIDPGVSKLYILKMIVQPVLENAIVHGVSSIERHGIIKIKSFLEDDKVIIEIHDNGKGISQTKIDFIVRGKWKDSKKLDRNIGIKNVLKRIKLNHGDEYGLSIESVEGEYTVVKYILPVIEQTGSEAVNSPEQKANV
jgi:two-component system, sensor histidine kinase YesM